MQSTCALRCNRVNFNPAQAVAHPGGSQCFGSDRSLFPALFELRGSYLLRQAAQRRRQDTTNWVADLAFHTIPVQ